MRRTVLGILTFFLFALPVSAEDWCFNLTKSGCTYCAGNFRGVAHASEAACGGLVPAMHDLVEEIKSAYSGTSPSTLDLALGTQAIRVLGSGFGQGVWVTVVKDDDVNKAAFGRLTTYNSETGDGTIDVTEVSGSGSGLAGWEVYAQRTVATVVTPPLGIPVGGTGGTTKATARAGLDVLRTRRVVTKLVTDQFFPFVLGSWYLVAPPALAGLEGHVDEYLMPTSGGYVFEAPEAGDVVVLEESAFGTPAPSLLYWTGSAWQGIGQYAPVFDSVANGGSITLVDYGPETGSGMGLGSTLSSVRADYSLSSSGGTVWLPNSPAATRIVLFANAAASAAKTLTVKVTGGGTISGATQINLTGGQSRMLFAIPGMAGAWFATP